MISNRSFTGSCLAAWWVLVFPSTVVVSQTFAADVPSAEARARQSWAPVATSNQPPQPLRDPVDWPAPIRNAPIRNAPIRALSSVPQATSPAGIPEHSGVPEAQNVGILSDLFGGAIGPGNPTPTHRVIRSPEFKLPKNKLGERYSQTHPPHTSHHQRKLGTPAMIPQAKESSSWKTPYSYGYFGASSKRSWSKHTGYRDRYTEWILQ